MNENPQAGHVSASEAQEVVHTGHAFSPAVSSVEVSSLTGLVSAFSTSSSSDEFSEFKPLQLPRSAS